MTTTEVPEVTITVSEPYHVVGFQGGRYGASAHAQRTYTASFMGHDITKTSKSDIQQRIRIIAFRATGSERVRFTFVNSQEG